MSQIRVRDPFADARGRSRRALAAPALWGWFDEFEEHFAPGRRGSLPLDVYETDDALSVEAQLPGVRKEEIQVTLERGHLTIRAEPADEREQAGEREGRSYLLHERRQDAVSRSLVIGERYDPEAVGASPRGRPPHRLNQEEAGGADQDDRDQQELNQ